MGKIKINVYALLRQTNTTPMDLVRHGISYATAYRLARGQGDGIEFSTLAALCDYFSNRMGRTVLPGEILIYEA